MDRLAGSWYPTSVEEWPLDEKHFGKDVEFYSDKVSEMFFTFNEDGTGQWSLGLMAGTLRVRTGKQAGHFMGEMLVTESDVDTDGWNARLNVSLQPGKTARIHWAWTCGPAKNTATMTYWQLGASYYEEDSQVYYGKHRTACAIM